MNDEFEWPSWLAFHLFANQVFVTCEARRSGNTSRFSLASPDLNFLLSKFHSDHNFSMLMRPFKLEKCVAMIL